MEVVDIVSCPTCKSTVQALAETELGFVTEYRAIQGTPIPPHWSLSAAREILCPNGEMMEGYDEADINEVAAIIRRHHNES